MAGLSIVHRPGKLARFVGAYSSQPTGAGKIVDGVVQYGVTHFAVWRSTFGCRYVSAATTSYPSANLAL